MNLVLINPTNSITKPEIEQLCTFLRDTLNEIKSYYTQTEKDTFSNGFLQSYQFAYKTAVQLAQSKCRSQVAMQRRNNILQRCQIELSKYEADYKAYCDY